MMRKKEKANLVVGNIGRRKVYKKKVKFLGSILIPTQPRDEGADKSDRADRSDKSRK